MTGAGFDAEKAVGRTMRRLGRVMDRLATLEKAAANGLRLFLGQPIQDWARAALHAAVALPIIWFLVCAVLALGSK